jgi:hypothetical protein
MDGKELNYAALATCIAYPELKPDYVLRKLGLINQKNFHSARPISKSQKNSIEKIMLNLGISFDTVQYDLGLDTTNIDSISRVEAHNIIEYYTPVCLM